MCRIIRRVSLVRVRIAEGIRRGRARVRRRRGRGRRVEMRGRGEAPHAGALPYSPIREPHPKQLHAPTRRARARVVPVVAAVGAAPSHDGSTRPARPPTLFLLPKEKEEDDDEDDDEDDFYRSLFLRF